MLLVMHTAGILQRDNEESQLWKLTWDRIDAFLPSLRDEVFKPHESGLYLSCLLLRLQLSGTFHLLLCQILDTELFNVAYTP